MFKGEGGGAVRMHIKSNSHFSNWTKHLFNIFSFKQSFYIFAVSTYSGLKSYEEWLVFYQFLRFVRLLMRYIYLIRRFVV